MNKPLNLLTAASCIALSATMLRAQEPQLPAEGERLSAFKTDDGRVQADSTRHRSEFTNTGVVLETPPLVENGEIPRLELTYLGSRRGDHHSPSLQDRAPDLSEKFVRYQRDNVVETYEVSVSGYEQSFHFAQRPEGHGDLVLSIGVNGNVQADACKPQHRGLDFSLNGTSAIRYSEAIAFDSAGQRIDVLTSYDGAGIIELTVPADFVESAAYPLVVDPAVGGVLNPGGPSFNDSNPDVAYDLANRRYMVVWQRRFDAFTTSIRGLIYNEDGAATTTVIQITPPLGICTNPAVAPCNKLDNDGFLVVWQQNGQIRGAVHDSITGGAAASAFGISLPNAGEVDANPTVSGPGNGAMMVAWDRTASGGINPDRIMLRDIYWTNPSLPLFPSQGPERTIEQVTTGGYVRSPRLANSDVRVDVGGTSWFANRIVWQRWFTSPVPGDWDSRTCSFRVRTGPYDFAVLHGPTTITGAGGIGPNELTPAIASRSSSHFDGEEDMQFCIAFEAEGDVIGHMYDLDGPVGSQMTIADDPNRFEGLPAVGAGHCEFTVAYGVITPPNEFAVDVYAARVELDGNVAINDRPIDVLNGPFQSNIRCSSRPIDNSGTRQTNTTMIAWYGATGPSGTAANDVRARFFEPVAGSTSLFGVACPGPGGELAAIGSTGGDPIPGNDEFALTMTGGVPLSLCVLVVGDTLTTIPIPGAPGCNLYMGLPFVTLFPTLSDGAGNASVTVPLPCSVPSGVTLAFQWGIYTPGHNAFGWITSNDMDVSWSHN